jgi:hypothetical protein
MGELDISGPPGEHDAQTVGQSKIPPMPNIGPSGQVEAVPHPLIDGISPTVGWQFRLRADGGPAFMIIRRSRLGSLKVVESFPLTEDGWAAAWRSFIKRDPYAAQKVMTALKAREADSTRLISPEDVTSSRSQATSESHPRPLVTLYNLVLLGGYLPDMEVFTGKRHHVQFFGDRLWLIVGRTAVPQVAVPYSEIEDVEIGGPGIVKTGGGFAGGGFGAAGAIEGMAIASILNGLTSRTSIKTILRIQGIGFELFLLHPGMTPEKLRIELSRPFVAIRSARASHGAGGTQNPSLAKSVSPVDELTKLADMLEKGLLTRDEFDLMKTKLMGL